MSILKDSCEVNIDDCSAIKFDYIVIGSGAAGGATALTLGDLNHNVLVVEAGSLLLTEHVGSLSMKHQPSILKSFCNKCSYQVPWISSTASSNEQVWSVAGGRTLFWGGHAPRFFAHEFSKWPLNFNDLKADYDWAEQLLHVENDFFANETEKTLIDNSLSNNMIAMASPLALEFASHKTSILPDLFFSSISKLIAHPRFNKDLNQPGIHLLCDAKAQKLLHNKGEITGLELLNTQTGKSVIIKAEHYILACGAFRSTQLVIDSDLSITSSLFKKNIGEHLFCKGLIRLDEPLEEPIYIYYPSTLRQPYMFEIQGPFKESWYDANYATVWLDWQSNNNYLLLYGFGIADVSLANSIESKGSGYQINYNYTPHDYQTMLDMQQSAEQLAEALEGDLVNLEFQDPGSSLHERGGMAMSEHPEDGVVSPDGQFWDYPNLYCTDTAIWPDQGAANSCLTITAIAHHLAKKLK
ncbi:MAG TPA: GMC oxidoreductase [Legionella sp.]|nr:GMC oxidoreductase [Legionella sp.]